MKYRGDPPRNQDEALGSSLGHAASGGAGGAPLSATDAAQYYTGPKNPSSRDRTWKHKDISPDRRP